MAVSNSEEKFRLVLEGVTKQYPGCLANDNVSMKIKAGTIYALLGENGAGKSTLMKMIYGVVKPDSGRMIWEGEEVEITAPVHARELGIGMVFQHFSLFETLTVLENIALGMDKQSSADLDALATKISEVSTRYGMALEPHRPVHTLSTGERQRVEIVRCLIQDIKLLILDEPTSVLTPQEVDTLFTTLKQLAAEGTSIMFISHKLKEVKALCDFATVLRMGAVSGSCRPKEESTTAMAKMMVGDDTPVTHNYEKATGGKDFLIVNDLNQATDDPFGVHLKSINFSVRKGEILGVAGVAGNGQAELLKALSGETISDIANSICFENTSLGKLTPNERRELGMGFVPEDRLGQGAVPDMSLWENGLLTGFLQGLVKKGFLQTSEIINFTQKIIKDYSVKCADKNAFAKSLSGGNLQKFIIGREILQTPSCLVASHPTWGVDIGAAISIHKALIKLRDQGSSILVISEDIDELFTISDRMCALFHGQLSPIKPTAETTIEEVGSWMAGIFDTNNKANAA
ncbi:ABC transporter ATP-binding protein [Dasania marina]|uniref:ABC transporter ATP-binding protein n=1 Tax=Dasania marina TaxID=471499 RepID=UPI0030DBC145|tara:strand:+ start:19057 stop:20607 length:1551 start_codon:yes stop_codon:yes gene_type:complete